jgi:thymidylate kinase
MIVVVEGPDGSGKTPLVNRLAKLGFVKYQCLFVPPFMSGYDDFIVWDTPEQAYGELMSISNFKNSGHSIVMDRGVPSWCIYNVYGSGACSLNDRMVEWNSLLKKWKHAIVVCLYSSEKNLLENVSKKTGTDTLDSPLRIELEDQLNIYRMIDERMRVDYCVEDYSKDWSSEVISKIFDRIRKV